MLSPKIDSLLGHLKSNTGLNLPVNKVKEAGRIKAIYSFHIRVCMCPLLAVKPVPAARGYRLTAALQEHHALFLAVSIACELLGAIAFIANWTVGAWLLVRLLIACM